MDEEKSSPFADLLTGIAWLVVAAAIVVGAWHMDRLERLAATIYTAPGLVPGLLGAAIGLMSVILIVRAIGAGALQQIEFPRIELLEHWRLIAALVFGLVFSLVLIGRGLPFWLASAIYIAVMVFTFQFPERRAEGRLLRGGAIAAVYGVIAGLAIHHLFQDLFLVRLP
jgi:hypothetical protein